MINSMLPPKSAIKAISNYTSPSKQSPSGTKRDAPNETDTSGNQTTMVTSMRDKTPKVLESCMEVEDDALGKAASENALADARDR